MLNFWSGHLIEGGNFECEECFNVGQEGGVVQTPEHWLGEWEILEDYWGAIGLRLGVGHRVPGVGGQWGALQDRLVGVVGNEWLTFGWIIAMWISLSGHWLYTFEGQRMGLEERVGRWEWLVLDMLHSWWLGSGPQNKGRWKLVEAICVKSKGIVYVEGDTVCLMRHVEGATPPIGIG